MPLPAGLTLNTSTGVISGTTTAIGVSPVTITVTDGVGATATQNNSLTVTGTNPPQILGGDMLPDCQVNVVYSATTVTAQNGVLPYHWSAVGMPVGVTINPSTGVVSGTPTVVGSTTPTVTCTDSATPTARTATQNYTVNITSAPTTLAIKTASPLPSATQNGSYSMTLSATGGQTPYTWALQSGVLPAGLTLSAGGVISGTPTESGTFTPTFQVTDAASTVATSPLSITVSSPSTPLQITSGDFLPDGTLTVPYGPITIAAVGGTPPYNWTFSNPPPGIGIFSTTGVVSGTPTRVGAYLPVATVTDATAATASQTYTVNIRSSIPAPTLQVAPQDGIVGVSIVLSGTGFPPNHTISATIGGAPLPLTPTIPIVAADGSWSSTFLVPIGSIAGPEIIVVTDA